MSFVLLDNFESWKGFLPLTFTRPLSEIRIGILTIKEKWEQSLGVTASWKTQDYLSKKFPATTGAGIFINSTFCPDINLAKAVKTLKPGEVLCAADQQIAFNGKPGEVSTYKHIDYSLKTLQINTVWDIFQKNTEALKLDFELLTHNKKSQPLSASVTVVGDRNLIFVEPGAKAEACTLNTTGGPVYIGQDAEIMEGGLVRGPFALCEHSVLKMGAKVYGATTIGPHCKVGGEVSNSVIFGYSNKAHDGFLGNSVIGEWCNLGADTNSSNLKNNYGNVKLFNYSKNKQVDTGLQFCGLIMGDHSKAGINTMFNTGTVAGIGCNIYGGGFPNTIIPNFSWGGSGGFEDYKLEKLFETAEKVYERRGLQFSDAEKEILSFVYEGGVKL